MLKKPRKTTETSLKTHKVPSIILFHSPRNSIFHSSTNMRHINDLSEFNNPHKPNKTNKLHSYYMVKYVGICKTGVSINV